MGSLSCRPPIFLLCISLTCTCCAPVETDCTQCVLPCDGAPGLSQHQSIIAIIKNHLAEREELLNATSLYINGCCSVPGCFQRDLKYSLKLHENNNNQVSVPVYEKADIQPVCQEPRLSDTRDPNGADQNISNKLLLLLAVCVCLL